MTATVLDRAGNQVGDALPQVGLALLVLVVGLIVARVVSRFAVRGLLRVGADRFGERFGVHDVLARAGLERSLSRLTGFALRLGLSVGAIIAALSLSGLAFLQESLNEGVLFLPRLATALALVLAGLVLAGAARQRVDRVSTQMDLRGPLGTVAQALVIGVAGIMAMGQLGIPTAILTVLAAIVVGGAVLTFALAFGLGSRQLAATVSAGRYVSAGFQVGESVEVAGLRGEIVSIESSSTVLEAEDGSRTRIPNHLFLEGPVRLLAAPGSGAR